jgi:hypothetical protein
VQEKEENSPAAKLAKHIKILGTQKFHQDGTNNGGFVIVFILIAALIRMMKAHAEVKIHTEDCKCSTTAGCRCP